MWSITYERITYESAEHGEAEDSAPGPDRWKERSRTYQGIAGAMASQWGNL